MDFASDRRQSKVVYYDMIFATVLMSSYFICSKLHRIDMHDRIENCIGLAIPTLCRDDDKQYRALSENFGRTEECALNCKWYAKGYAHGFIWRSLAIFLFGIIKYSPIDQRTESSVYLPLISFRRYVIYGWIIISVWALRASESPDPAYIVY